MYNNSKKELKIWDERVLFDVKFKEDTKADLNQLDKILEDSLEKFTLISANSEALVYKIGRYFIQKGMSNNSFTFIEGKIIETYIGDESVDWKKKERADDFFRVFGDEYKSKWVLIPAMSFQIDIGLAMYFMNKFKVNGAIGVIFYGQGPNNIAEVLVYNSEDPNFHQFPIKAYRPRRKRVLPDDEW